MKQLHNLLINFRDYLLGCNYSKMNAYKQRIQLLEQDIEYQRKRYIKLDNERAMLINEIQLLRTFLKADPQIKKY